MGNLHYERESTSRQGKIDHSDKDPLSTDKPPLTNNVWIGSNVNRDTERFTYYLVRFLLSRCFNNIKSQLIMCSPRKPSPIISNLNGGSYQNQ